MPISDSKVKLTLVDLQSKNGEIMAETVDDFIQQTRRGEFYGIAMVGVAKDGRVTLALDTGIHKKGALLALIGAATVLRDRLRWPYTGDFR